MRTRKTVLIVMLYLHTALQLFSQDHGVQWILGCVPNSILDFRNDTLVSHHVNDTIPTFVCTANICDTNGEFLFFTNGIYVRDRFGNYLQNGDSLGYDPIKHSAFNSVYNSVYPSGAPNHQGVIILPKPGSNHLYYIFHFMPIDTSFISNGVVYGEPTRFYYSVVDMNANFGAGAVVKKNVRLPLGLQCASRMTACKHANGRDWWIIRHGFRDSTYYKFLFTPDTILGPFVQTIGPPYQVGGNAFDYYGTSVFNVTGDRFASANQLGPVVVMDFDRCSGDFSNPLVIQNLVPDTTVSGAMGLAFSPNSQFLYVSNKVALNQYDLAALNINDSVRLFTETNSSGYAISRLSLAPDNKIYVATWHGGNFALHVIHNPNEPGFSCDFELNGFSSITANTNVLPNLPNYKLGALIGSGCDTLVSSLVPQLQSAVSVYISPNPASDYITLQSEEGNFPLQLNFYNSMGQYVKAENVSVNNGTVSISDLPNGTYGIIFDGPKHLKYSSRLTVLK